ncbi:hypothetical protein C2R22_21765 (plasmid) [Salinigranum rubrum]|uniref:DUF485 domain-containing protein n=1 Tax=Salinigranum rubrum TaxID=755307 RepID=A0A2I8VQK4_9EURY|nr:hypothetical protein [Salinigranum rubrum]AUV84198.1 hypothetical protein C2R22_21765 [Salinigranum rubrum]
MAWSEGWRSEDRPDTSQIPEEYRLSANMRENLMIGYFAGIIGVAYFALRFMSEPTLIAGIPALMWLTVGVSALVMLGLYISFARQGVVKDVTQVQSGGEAGDD